MKLLFCKMTTCPLKEIHLKKISHALTLPKMALLSLDKEKPYMHEIQSFCHACI